MIEEAAKIIARSKYLVALTGAGVSTESKIPDFRGPNGIWTKNPEAEKRAYEIFPIFLKDPKRYWDTTLKNPLIQLIKNAEPNPSHYALAELEKIGILKCIITQNIDNLHQKAGSKNVIDFHGNLNKLRCLQCNKRYDYYVFEDVPYCKCGYPLKLDVVYFGEPIPQDVYFRSIYEVSKCDVMLVAGTSAVVYPAADLPRIAKRNGAFVIEVNLNKTPLTEDGTTDIFIEGKTGEILPKIVELVKRFKNIK